MLLQAYLDEQRLSYRAFAAKREPKLSHITVWQWAKGLRFPSDPGHIEWIREATDGRVTSDDLISHVLEIRRLARLADLSPRRYVATLGQVA